MPSRSTKSRSVPTGVRPSPAARRTVELLTHLAAHPGRAFTVSELARDLVQNRATCHAILLSLESADWVRRDARKAWGLGPGLIPVGDSAQTGLPGIDALRAAVAQLQERLGLETLATVATGGQIVVAAHASGPAGIPPAMRVGQTIPFVPPLGLVFVAWGGGDALARWLARSPTPLSRRDRLMQALAHDEYLVVDPDPLRGPDVSQLAAPVFGSAGEVVAAISLVASPQQISVANAARLADALLACARGVSARLNGR